MVIRRGEIWWATVSGGIGGESIGSRPALVRPVLVVQADSFNRSGIQTVIVAVLTSNVALADAPGNVLLEPYQSGLPRPSVVNVSAIVTLNKTELTGRVGPLGAASLETVERGLRLVLEV